MALYLPWIERSISLRMKKRFLVVSKNGSRQAVEGDLDEEEFDSDQESPKFNLKKLLKRIELLKKTSRELPFKHSGTLGDVIYSIPVMKKLAGKQPIKLFLETDYYCANLAASHPLKGLRLSNESISLIAPLLESQDIKVEKFNGEKVIDLDLFSETGFPLGAGHIAQWYHYAFVMEYDIYSRWLKVPKNKSYKDTIVITRTERYNNPSIDYSFLKDYKNIIFLGLRYEYERLNLENVQYCPVNNFLEAAIIINSCKFFIGNQTFLYSLAEALKVPRILECCMVCPNVTPLGGKAYEVCYQDAFEYAFHLLSEK